MVSGQEAGAIGLGLFAALIGAGGIVAAISRWRRRAEIAPTYGATGGIAYTIVQAGCSGMLLLGGLGLIAVALMLRR
jgi:hypothetical protein